ncbi:MAG: glycosyltransferase family 9 protein, partial [Negativicutes bacterium]
MAGERILVIDLAFIGDVILATPTMRALKEAYPAAHITMLTVPLTADVAAMDPYVDEVMVYDKR